MDGAAKWAQDGILIARHTRDQRRRGLEESTIRKRANIVRRLSKWLEEQAILDASQDDIEYFLDGCRTGPKARYAYISNLHTFYEWAVHAGLLEKSPTAGIVRPRLRKGLPRPVSDTDLAKALGGAVGMERVVMALGAFQGMRCIEISRLAREDVLEDREPPVLVARGKGGRSRVLPLHPEVAAALYALPMPSRGPIVRRNGRPLTASKVSLLGNDFLRSVGIDATMHQLRHWYATGVYRTSGRNLLLVRDLLGHSLVETTAVYADYDRREAAEAVRLLGV